MLTFIQTAFYIKFEFKFPLNLTQVQLITT